MNPTSVPSLAVEAPEYVALQREVHDALRTQHPEWILPNGDCPTGDFYDARFAELLIAASRASRTEPRRDSSNSMRISISMKAIRIHNYGGPEAGIENPTAVPRSHRGSGRIFGSFVDWTNGIGGDTAGVTVQACSE